MHKINDKDPAFRYEALARAAFNNCPKYGDPFRIAAQDVYNSFVGEIKLDGRRALSTVLIKLIIDHPQSRQVDNLKKLDDKVWEAKTQGEIIKIIDQAIEICENKLEM